MIHVTIDEKGTVLRLKGFPQRATQSLQRAIAREVIDLANHVKQQKLSGQVLKNRSGTLRRSTRAYPPVVGGQIIRGEVAVDKVASKYGYVHEHGGRFNIPQHARKNRVREGTHTVRAHTATFKERSFMRSSLRERRPTILANLRRAVGENLR